MNMPYIQELEIAAIFFPGCVIRIIVVWCINSYYSKGLCGNLRIDYVTTGYINTYDRGRTWTIDSASGTIYIINGIPQNLLSTDSGATENADSGYSYGTACIQATITAIYEIDDDKNIIETLYSAS